MNRHAYPRGPAAAAGPLALLLLAAALALSACGREKPQAAGQLNARAIWPAKSAATASAPRTYTAPAVVAKITASVSAADIVPAVQKSFDTAAFPDGGPIEDVPAGSGRTLTLLAYGADGTLLYKGVAANLVVSVGAVTTAEVWMDPQQATLPAWALPMVWDVHNWDQATWQN
jgi:hypothetical protein